MRRPVQVRKSRRDADALVAPNAWPPIHAAWIETISSAADLGRDRARIADYTADVVETLFVRPDGIGGALARFGHRLGSEGWPLEQVSCWIDWLAEICSNPPSNYLRSFASGVSLAHGWTEGNLRGMRAEECFDAVTGLCTMAVLRLRLQQVFEQCAALGLEPNWLHRLVIIDADVADCTGISTLEADAVMVVLADLVQQRFVAGETIAREGGRIFVLVNNAEQITERLASVLEATRDRSLFRAARVIGWVEDLPAASAQIDRYMADLSV